MSYQVLARKYRPQKFSDVIGQEHVTRTLKNAIEQGRIAHGYIFSGHRGIGKTTVARILAMALNCRSSDKPAAEPCGVCESCVEIRAGNSVDVIEIDAATNRGIDEIRELREAARYRPARDRFKIYILDEAHQITDAAFNALLKTLEEPPGHVIFMLATTQPADIPETIRSRCQHFGFRAVEFDQIAAQLRDLCAREQILADEAALALVAEAGDGSMRDALSILDQAIASADGGLSEASVRQLVGVASSGALEEIMQAVARGSGQELFEKVDRLLTEGQNPVQLARQLVRFLRNTTVAKVAGADSRLLQVSSDERARIARIAELFSEEDLARHLEIMLRTHGELGYRGEQRFRLELGLLKLAHAQRLVPLEELLSDFEGNRGAAQAKRPRAPESKKSGPPPAAQPLVSPFTADSVRKGTPRSELSEEPGGTTIRSRPALNSIPVAGGAAAPAVAVRSVQAADPGPGAGIEEVRAAVLQALAQSEKKLLASMLEAGEWKLEASQLTISVAASSSVVKMSVDANATKAITASAGGVLGRAVKLQIVPGENPGASPMKPAPSFASGTSRARAEQEPVVRRMKEKFGAEIRTVIDYRNR